ncbi:MAG: hypothetical protein ACRCW9_05975 [Cetobacterium sp.]
MKKYMLMNIIERKLIIKSNKKNCIKYLKKITKNNFDLESSEVILIDGDMHCLYDLKKKKYVNLLKELKFNKNSETTIKNIKELKNELKKENNSAEQEKFLKKELSLFEQLGE